jgi:hypothetical protein
MTKGTMTIRVLFYQTNRSGKVTNQFYEDGYSHLQEINNKNQEETAFNQALANATHKYSYHIGRRYDDVEYNYHLKSSKIVYVSKERNKKTQRYGRYVEKTRLTGSDKRRIHKNNLKQSEIRRSDKDKDEYETSKEILNLRKQQYEDTQTTFGKSKTVRVVKNRKKKPNR